MTNRALTFVEGRNLLDLEKKLDQVRILMNKGIEVVSVSTSAPWIAWFYTDQTKVPLQYRMRGKELKEEIKDIKKKTKKRTKKKV